MKKNYVLILFMVVYATALFSQSKNINDFDEKLLNWYNSDLQKDKVVGASVDKAYNDLLANKKAKKTVVVAVIDGGVDVNITDLKGRIWINEDEIPNNKIDDDKNGYVDDIYGWNFIGNTKGENILYENYEFTRIYKGGKKEELYSKAKALYEAELDKREKEKEMLLKFERMYLAAKEVIKEETNVDVQSAEDLEGIKSKDQKVKEAVAFLKERYNMGFTENGLYRRINRNEEFLKYFLNVDFNPRELIGDNPNDIQDNKYGNWDVVGNRASHGTCVAGIIAGVRENNFGVEGVATDVRIMTLRVVPSGDERDKDIALAIRYAVDNGADIINMSFGKVLSPQQKFVSDAIKYAEQKNVLIVHAAGNSGDNIDENIHYPSDIYIDNNEAANFINVGSCGMSKEEKLASVFSNYGQEHVDIFAPGENIISLDSVDIFDVHSGTSQAAPVVTGVAAVILAYYPELTPSQLIDLLIETSQDFKDLKVMIPDLVNEERKLVKFRKLSKSGGVVSLYNALKKLQGK